MEITEVRVFPVEDEKLKAYVTITFDDSFKNVCDAHL